MHFTDTIYYTIISKFQKFAKNSKIVRSSKKNTSQVGDIIHDASMEFENYPRITVWEDAFFSYYMLYHYFKVSKIRQKFKNSPIVKKKKNTSQVGDIIHDASMEFENYPSITVWEDPFFSYYMLYHYFKVSKIRQKFKNSPIVKKSTNQVADIIQDASMEFENYPRISVGEHAFFSYYMLYHYFKVSKIRQKFKNNPIV